MAHSVNNGQVLFELLFLRIANLTTLVSPFFFTFQVKYDEAGLLLNALVSMKALGAERLDVATQLLGPSY